jgi:Zn-dependent protease with chaperone function
MNQEANGTGAMYGMNGTGKWTRYGLLLLLLYAAVAAAYVWYTSPNTVPAAYRGTAVDPATFYTPAQLVASEAINAIRNWIFLVSWPWQWAIYLWLLSSGRTARWSEALRRRGLPVAVRFPLIVLLIELASFLLYMPLRIISYSTSRAYGITTQPVLGWLRDKLVGFGIGFLTMLAVAAVAYWFVNRGGRWWLKLWLLSIPFTLFMMYVQPAVIDPLYNTFTRLSNPQLEKQILALAAKANIPTDRVYEVDMSAKTNAMNAYVNGIGSNLRIVLWDTTLHQLTEQEVLLVMAHEMGHYVMHHLEWSALGAVGSSLIVLWLGSRLYVAAVRRYGGRFKLSRPGDVAALPLTLLLLSLLSFVSLPVTNAVSRHAEASADRYAMELIGSADGAVSMNQKMAKAALDEIKPPLLIHIMGDDHPTDFARILDAERFAHEHESK